MKNLYKQYQEKIYYLVFGVLTTLINIIVYYGSYNYLHLSNVISNILAWLLSVLFAYITNKLWVFSSKTVSLKTILFELGSFFICRLATGVIDLAIMYISVDLLASNSLGMKIIANIVVIILNYITSKYFIFKKGENQ